MASIIKKNGKWSVRVSWYDENGKRHYNNKGGFNTKAEANIFASKTELTKKEGYNSYQDLSFADYFWDWFKLYKQVKIAKVTTVKYNRIRIELTNFFGAKPINKIKRRDYQKFLNNFGETHAPDTVRAVNGKIRRCVLTAIYDDVITKDFTFDVEISGNKDREWQVEYLSTDEIKRLTNYIIQNLNPNHASNYMIITAIFTGMRLSEIGALQWSDINFNFKTISITKSWDYYENSFKPVKTASSKRTIKINDTLISVLKELKLSRLATEKDLVFTTNGWVPTSNAVNKALRIRFKKLNIIRPHFHFHSLRHSHVAYLISQGVDIFAISKRLGHSTLSTTIDTYAYLIDEYRVQNDEKINQGLDNLLNNESAPKVHQKF